MKYRLNDFLEAKQDITRALELSPDFVDAKSCLDAIDHAVSSKTPTEQAKLGSGM